MGYGLNSVGFVASYPSAVTAYPPPPHQQAAEGYASGPNVAPPPPVGYPTVEGSEYPQQNHPVENTKSRGDNFWKGW